MAFGEVCMTDNLVVYKTRVLELASESKNFRIANRSVEHAAALLEAIFANAKTEVRLFCGNFDENFYFNQLNLKEAVHGFLSKPDTSLHILTEKSLPKAHKMASILQSTYQDKVEIRTFKNVAENLNPVSHFAVMDRLGFRFEFSHDATDASIVEAVANFNEPEVAIKLAERFDLMFDDSK
jgi:hypothetical protein